MRHAIDPLRLVHVLPDLSDDTALELSMWLRQLSAHFDNACHEQILRAHRKRRRDRRRQIEQRSVHSPQAKRPEEFELGFPGRHP